MPRTETPQWENYKKMIAGHAWKFSRKYGVEFEELQSEGNLIFTEALNRFDSERAAFSTFLWRCLVTGLTRFCQRERRQANYNLTDTGDLPDSIDNCHMKIDTGIYLRQSFAALNNHGCQTILKLATQPDLLGLTLAEPPRVVKAAIRDHLRSSGDSWSIVANTVQTLKQLHAEA